MATSRSWFAIFLLDGSRLVESLSPGTEQF
jgi:hypothetical protein